MSEVPKIIDLIKALEKAEMISQCMTNILEFIEIKGLGEELMAYLHGKEDEYFMTFLKRW